MNALITGDCGFIGRHFRQVLEAAGHDVTGVDIADPRRRRDAREFFATSGKQFDLVIHCAAVVGGRAKIEGTPLDLAVDLALDADMFQWALRTRPSKVVYFSSSAAYPTLLQQRKHNLRLREDLINLDAIANPDHLYGWSKLTGEILARHAQDTGVDVLVVRPFSGYGEDQALDYPFPAFIARAKRRDDPFEIWGDGTQVRDWIHVDDIVGAVLAAIDLGVLGPVNLGTGDGTSFNDLARMVCAATGYEPRFDRKLTAPIGVHTRVCDPEAMFEFYLPTVTLEQGIVRALAAGLVAA